MCLYMFIYIYVLQQGWFIDKEKCETSSHKHREGIQQP